MDREGLAAAVDRDDVRLFIAFLLIFTLFIQWNSVNAYSRYDLTRAIVEDSSADISPYAYNTLDKTVVGVNISDYRNASTTAFVLNRSGQEGIRVPTAAVIENMFDDPDAVVYSDKAPMASFLAVPPYLVAEAVVSLLGVEDRSRWIDRGLVSVPVSVGTAEAVKQFLITFTVSALFGAFLLVLLYRHLRDHLERRYALYAAVIAGLGTFLFHYATTFFGTMTAASLGFASFFLLQRYRMRSRRMVAVAGVLGGLALSTEYYAALIPLGVALYLISYRDRAIVHYSLGVVLGTVPLLAYNLATTGNPFQLAFLQGFSGGPIYAAPCHLYTACLEGVILPNIILDPGRVLNVALRLLFYPTRGLLFYAPVLLLAIPGSYALYKRDRRLLLVSPGIFILLFLFHAVQLNWLAGVSFGPRYMIVGLPFLVLPLGLGLKEAWARGQAWQLLVAVLVGLSMFNMLLGFNGVPTPTMDRDTYTERFTGVAPVQPDLYSTFVENTLEYGPRSEVLMSLLGREKGFDVTYLPPYGPEAVELGVARGAFVLLRTAALPVVALLLILGLVMRRGWERTVLAVGIGVLLLASLAAATVHVPSDEYRGGDAVTVVSGGNATLAVQAGAGQVVRLDTEVMRPLDRARIAVTVNGEKAGIYDIAGRQPIYLAERLRDGRNTITLSTEEGCVIPAAVNGSSDDVRCLSVRVRNVHVLDPSDAPVTILANGGVHLGDLEEAHVTWMRNGSTILFHANRSDTVPRIAVAPSPAHADAALRATVNGETLRTVRPPDTTRPIHLPDAPIEPGWNTLRLESAEPCAVPADYLAESADTRCLSFRLDGFDLVMADAVPDPLYLSGWYPERNGTRAMVEKAELRFTATAEGAASLDIAPPPGLETNLTLRVNGGTRRVLPGTETVAVATALRDGWNTAELQSAEGCVVPAEQDPRSNDTRCFTLDLRDVTVLAEDELPPVLELDGWYPGAGERWMREEARLAVRADADDLLRFAVERAAGLNGSLAVAVNGEDAGTVGTDGTGAPVTLVDAPLRAGKNLVTFTSTAGCVVPAAVSTSSDTRCLSFDLVNRSTVPPDAVPDILFREGWYTEEETGRWMQENATLRFHQDVPGTLLRLELDRYDGLGNASVVVRHGGAVIRNLSLTGNRTVTLPVVTPGWNTLELESVDGCVVPAEQGNSTETRCLGLHVSNVSLVDDEDIGVRYLDGWYEQERGNEETWRWMQEEGTIAFSAAGNRTRLAITLDPYPYLGYPNLLVAVNGREPHVRFPDEKATVNVTVETRPGINVARLESGSGCRVPAEQERTSGDTRCLSFRVLNVTVADVGSSG